MGSIFETIECAPGYLGETLWQIALRRAGSAKSLPTISLLHHWQREDEREARPFSARVDLQRAPHRFDQRAYDSEPKTGAREAKLHAFGRKPIAQSLEYFIRDARPGVLDPELDPVCGNFGATHRDRSRIRIAKSIRCQIQQRLLDGGRVSDSGVVLGELNSERNAFLLAHRLHDRAHGVHRLAYGEWQRLPLNQPVAACRADEI